MGLFNKYFDRITKEPAREYETLIEKTGFEKFKYLCFTFFWRFILLNFLFIATCIPIVTIPVSITAMYRVCMRYLMEKHVDIKQHYFEEFKRSFGKSWLITLTIIVMLSMVGIAAFAYSLLLEGFALTVFIVISLLLMLWIFSIGCYAFSLLAATSDSFSVLMKNAVLMSVTELKTTVIMIIVPGTLLFAVTWFFPVTILLILFGIPVFIGLFVCSMTIDTILEHSPEKNNN